MISKTMDTVMSLSVQIRKTLRVFESLVQQIRGKKK